MKTITYITSLLTFYLKGEVVVGDNFVRFREPNTILGLIPLGAKKENVPVTQIAATQTNFKLKFGKLIIGIAVLVLALYFMRDSFAFGIILLLIAANSIIDAFEIDLSVSMSSGQTKNIDFFIFEKRKAERAEAAIHHLISQRLDETNTKQQTDRIVDAMNNK